MWYKHTFLDLNCVSGKEEDQKDKLEWRNENINVVLSEIIDWIEW